jgi:hypothetical protein
MKGRPFLGVFSGFFFGLFGAATLFLYGVIPLDSHLVWILPIVGIVLGLFIATWAPFGSGDTVGSRDTDTASDVQASSSAPGPQPTEAAVSPPEDTVVDDDPPVEISQPPPQE